MVVVRILFLLGLLLGSMASLQAAKRPFSVADDIELSRFGVRTSFDDDPFVFSPDHQFLAVYAEHGRLDLNRPESILRVYRTDDIFRAHKERQSKTGPSPLWEVRQSTYRHGPILTRLRWLRDSSGVTFLTKAASGNYQLVLADVRTGVTQPLTSDDQYVTSFDIQSAHNFVYAVLTRAPARPAIVRSAIVGTGKNLSSLMFSDESPDPENSDRSELWAVVNDRRFKMRDPESNRSLTLYPKALALSPDGQSLVTVLPVEVVPAEWEKRFPLAPMPWGTTGIRAGRQDLNDPHGFGMVEEYVLIDLLSGKIQSLTGAPSAANAAWWSWPSADWSSNGRSVALVGVFVRNSSSDSGATERPCVAVIDLGSRASNCVESVYGAKGDDELQWHIMARVRFAPGSDTRVVIDSFWSGDQYRFSTYTRGASGHWAQDTVGNEKGKQLPFDVSIKQSLNDPPVLLATDRSTKASRVIWDPNPQLRDIALGEVSVFRWKDPNGRNDVGGLFKPPDYVSGRRYPLVIQTHGFIEDQFIPSGGFPTATAAQELAAHGMLVLQARGEACAPSTTGTPAEAPCAIGTYEAAAKELIKAGLVDPDRLGMIGFSRTCFYVLEELTAGTLRFKTAAITDGVGYGYLQYLQALDSDAGLFAREADAIIGAPPFGDGLTQWLKRSPGFKMDRVETPLQVVALDKHESLMNLWETYATLRYLGKPVDLMIIPDSEHVISNPGERVISQGGTVDWFRFWLRDEEDPDPAKAEQYQRWRELRKLQMAQDAERATSTGGAPKAH